MRVEPAGGLVEQDQLRIVDQRLGQTQAARHAFGIFAHLPPARPAKADHVDQRFGFAVAAPMAGMSNSRP